MTSQTMLKLLRKAHKWIGLAVLALLLLQAATGLTMVYRWDVARLLDPQGMTSLDRTEHASLDRIAATIGKAFPGLEPSRMRFPDRPGATYFVYLQRSDGETVYASIDAGSASILRSGGLTAFPTEAAFELHHELMAGATGRAIVGSIGVLLFTLLVIGFVLWLPRGGGLRSALSMQLRGSPQRATLDLHRVPGAIAAIPMLMVAATGAFIALQPLLAAPPTAVGGAAPGRARLDSGSLESAVAMARHVYPHNSVREVRFPADGMLWVLFRAPDISARAVHIVRVDPRALQVVEIRAAEKHTALATYLLSFHTGEKFGAAGRATALLSGLMLLSMPVTGALVWLQRRRARMHARRRPQPAVRST
jgi:uncharacterized iron-regulated membrane protein